MIIDKIKDILGMKAEKKRPTHPVEETQKPMKIKERLQIELMNELEPLGFKHLKSKQVFKKVIDKNTTVFVLYEAASYHRGFTDVELSASGNYADVEEIIFNLNDIKPVKDQHFGLFSRMQRLMPEGESANWDFVFRDSDSEEVIKQKLQKIIWRMKTILLPYVDRLSHRDTAFEEAIALDKKFLIWYKCAIPVMYCVWKHDKKKAFEYLEQRRLQLLSFVKPWEWDRVDAFRNGERFSDGKYPTKALSYLDFMTVAEKFKKWADEQEWD